MKIFAIVYPMRYQLQEDISGQQSYRLSTEQKELLKKIQNMRLQEDIMLSMMEYQSGQKKPASRAD